MFDDVDKFFNGDEDIEDDGLYALEVMTLDNRILGALVNVSTKKAFKTYTRYLTLQYTKDRQKLIEKAKFIYFKVFKSEYMEMESGLAERKVSSFIIAMKENKFTYREIQEAYDRYQNFSQHHSIDPYTTCLSTLSILKNFEDKELEEILC